MSLLKRIITVIISAALMGTIFSGCSLRRKNYDELNVTFLKVGKADAIVVKTADHAVLIDAANQGEGKDIFQYCQENDFTQLDYFILTHFDQDHVGGAKAVINKFSVLNILQPDYTETNQEYLNYRDALEEKNYTPEIIKKTYQFKLDDAIFTVYPPLENLYESTNNYSLVITMEYGKKMFLFAGDAENIRLDELMTQLPERKSGYDLVKMPHHGQSEKSTGDFIDYIKPEYAVITCSKKESASDRTLKILNDKKTDIFFSYNGNITFSCDGYKIKHSEQTEDKN